MPPVAAAVVAGALSGITVSATFAIGFSWSAALLGAAGSLVLGFAERALTPKPKSNLSSSSSYAAEAGGFTQTVRAPLATHKIVHGHTRVGGAMVYAGMTSANKFLHMAIVVAAHEIESIDEVWFDDVAIPTDALDGSGNVTAGKFSNLARIKKLLGQPNQVADSTTVSEVSEWTTNHRLQGLAYLMVRLQYDQDQYPNGIPNITCFIKGKKVNDPRTSLQKFTTNSVLHQFDYFTSDDYGLSASDSMDMATVIASANIADEMVEFSHTDFSATAVNASTDIITLSGDALALHTGDRVEVSSAGTLPSGLSGSTDYYVIAYQFQTTPRIKLAASLDDAMASIAIDLGSSGSGGMTVTKTGEPRYHGGGITDTDNTLQDNIQDMLTATAGRAIYVGGKWKLKVGAYEAPSIELGEGDIIDTITTSTMLSLDDRFTTVQGVYRTPLNLDEPSDYPAMVSDTFAAQDGKEKIRQMDTPYTQRPQTSRRIAKIELLKSRQELVVKMVCNLRAMRVECGGTVMLTFPRYGWTQKIFEVTNFALIPRTQGDAPGLGVALDLRETDSSCFDWSTSEEQTVDPAPNSTLPNAFDVDPVTGVNFDSRPLTTLQGDTIYVISMLWNPHPDAFVVQGGEFEIEYKLSSEDTYRPSFKVSGDRTFSDIFQADPLVAYDVRIRAINILNRRSIWTQVLGVAAGAGGGVVTDSEDWGDYHSSPGSSDDWGDYHSSGTTDDWGAWA